MPDERSDSEIAFDAVRQFTFRPDRRYHIRLSGPYLVFEATGGQFDRAWLIRGLETGPASRVLPEWVRGRLKGLAEGPRTTLIMTGLGLVAASILLMVVLVGTASGASGPLAAKHGRQLVLVMPILVFLMIAGLVFAIVAFLLEDEESVRKHDFRLHTSAIREARVVKGAGGHAARNRPGGGARVAVLELYPRSGEVVSLAIPTEADLAHVEHDVIPLIGKSVATGQPSR